MYEKGVPMTEETKVNMSVVFMLALCIWREARNQRRDAKLAVACVIRNRANHPKIKWWGNGYFEVITAPWQFTSFNKPTPKNIDPNVHLFPSPKDHVSWVSWLECLAVAQEVYEMTVKDVTEGADHYFDKSLDNRPPTWAKSYRFIKDIGNFHFYKSV